ncbi:MAG: hypothetical protein AAB791_02620 [Patescibacteria group bacterium]
MKNVLCVLLLVSGIAGADYARSEIVSVADLDFRQQIKNGFKKDFAGQEKARWECDGMVWLANSSKAAFAAWRDERGFLNLGIDGSIGEEAAMEFVNNFIGGIRPVSFCACRECVNREIENLLAVNTIDCDCNRCSVCQQAMETANKVARENQVEERLERGEQCSITWFINSRDPDKGFWVRASEAKYTWIIVEKATSKEVLDAIPGISKYEGCDN